MPHNQPISQVFQLLPNPSLILLSDAPKFTITAVNTAYLEAGNFKEKDLLGKGIFEVFPENPEGKISNGTESFRNSLNLVIAEKDSHKMPLQKYDLPLGGTSKFKLRYAIVQNIPIKDDNNKLTHIFHSVEEVIDNKKLELSLETERQRFNDLYFQAPSCMGILKGPTHVFEFANPLYLQLIGTKDIIGKTVREVLPEVEGQGIFEILNVVYKTGETFSAKEMLFKFDKEGKGKIVEMYEDVIYQPHRDINGNIDGIFFFFIDVTELVLARKKIEESEKRYRELIHNLPIATYCCDLEGRIVLYNKAAAALWGREPEIGKDMWCASWKIYSENGSPLSLDRCPMAIALKEDRKITDQEIIVERPNGDKLNVLSYPVPFLDHTGQITEFVNVLIDITDRKKAENKVQESEMRYQLLIEQANDAIFVADASEKFIEVNSSGCHLTGYTKEEFLRLSMKDLLFEEDLKTDFSKIESLKNGKTTRHEQRIKRSDGTSIELEFSGKRLEDGRIINIANDITQRKKAQRNLIQSEKRLKQAQEIAHLGSWELNFETGIYLWSNEACKIYGISPKDNKQTHSAWLSFIHPEDLGGVLKAIEESSKTLRDQILNFRIILKDGTIKFIYGISKFEFDNNQNPIGLYGITQDVTETTKAEKKVRFQSNLLNIISQAGISANENGIINFWNKAATEIYGWSAEEALGKNVISLISTEQKEGDAREIMHKLSQGNTSNEFVVRHKDGHTFSVFASTSPIYGKHGKYEGAMEVSLDITGRKKEEEKLGKLIKELAYQNQEKEIRAAELILSNKELLKTNKELDSFVYSVSHDLRSPLTSILGLISFIEEDSREPDTLEQVKMIRTSINRLDGFIKNILSYSQNNRTGLEMVKIPIEKTIGEIVDSVRNIKDAEGISFQVEIDEQHPFYSDWQRFNTILENLISNAIKYHTKEVSGRYLKLSGTTDNKELKLRISDNGIGIDEAYHKKIFDMFYRLPGTATGSGFGLYVVKETLEKLHGKIEIQSEKGVGTTFIITLKNLKEGIKHKGNPILTPMEI